MSPPDRDPGFDGALARRVERGDRAAFACFYERCFAPAYAFARRRRASEPEAEALCERILAAALAGLDGYRGECALEAWLLCVAREVADAACASSGSSRGSGAELARRRAHAPAEDRVEVRE